MTDRCMNKSIQVSITRSSHNIPHCEFASRSSHSYIIHISLLKTKSQLSPHCRSYKTPNPTPPSSLPRRNTTALCRLDTFLYKENCFQSPYQRRCKSERTRTEKAWKRDVYYLLIPKSYILCSGAKVTASAPAVRYALLNRKTRKSLFEDNVDINGERRKRKKKTCF